MLTNPSLTAAFDSPVELEWNGDLRGDGDQLQQSLRGLLAVLLLASDLDDVAGVVSIDHGLAILYSLVREFDLNLEVSRDLLHLGSLGSLDSPKRLKFLIILGSGKASNVTGKKWMKPNRALDNKESGKDSKQGFYVAKAPWDVSSSEAFPSLGGGSGVASKPPTWGPARR